MSYSSEVLADSPGVYFRLDDSSLEHDSSGNSRDLNISSGTGPTLAGDGPVLAGSASWGSSAGFKRTTYTQSSGLGVGTIEFFVKFASAPAATLTLAGWSPNSGGDVSCFHVQLLTDGKIRLRGLNTGFSVVSCDSASALTTGVWHHVACSVGAAGLVIRINGGANTGSGATTAFASPNVSAFRVHGRYNSGDTDQTGAAQLAEVAWYPTQLSNARTDAHYAAVPVPITVAGNVAVSAATALSGAVIVPVAGQVATLVATALEGASFPVTIGGEVAPLTTAALSGSLLVGPLPGQVATVTAAALSGGVTAPVDSDTSNALSGRTRLAYASAEVIYPTPETATTRVDKAVPLPTPTMVNGRPT